MVFCFSSRKINVCYKILKANSRVDTGVHVSLLTYTKWTPRSMQLAPLRPAPAPAPASVALAYVSVATPYHLHVRNAPATTQLARRLKAQAAL